MKDKGTQIEHVIAYLEKRRAEGYTHVAIETPDRQYSSFILYDECSRKDEGVIILGGTTNSCIGCERKKEMENKQ